MEILTILGTSLFISILIVLLFYMFIALSEFSYHYKNIDSDSKFFPGYWIGRFISWIETLTPFKR